MQVVRYIIQKLSSKYSGTPKSDDRALNVALLAQLADHGVSWAFPIVGTAAGQDPERLATRAMLDHQ